MTKTFVADCRDSGSIHFSNKEMADKIRGESSYFQGRPKGLTLKVKGQILKRDKNGAVVEKSEKELSFSDVYVSAGGKRNPDLVVLFPKMNGAGEWDPAEKYSVEISWAE